jgi:hypothetical protein
MEKREIGSRAAGCNAFCVYTERDMSRAPSVTPSFAGKRWELVEGQTVLTPF